MRNFAIYLLMYPLILFACLQDRQRNLVNHNTVLLDSTATDTSVNHKETLLIDSAKVTIFASVLDANTINISVYKDREGVIEQEFSPRLKEKLSEAESKLIIKRISNVFIESNSDIIVSKKYLPEIVVSDLPLITFEIYIRGKKIVKDYIVGTRQEHYKITYSKSFLDLYNHLFGKAKSLYEQSKYTPVRPEWSLNKYFFSKKLGLGSI